MDQILEKLFESVAKARILRLFLQNPYSFFTLEETARKTQIKKSLCKKEIAKLFKLKVIKTKTSFNRISKGRKTRRKKIKVFGANTGFDLFRELRELVSRSSITSKPKLLTQFKKIGRVKLVILAGIFINNENSRTDILIVGEGIKKRRLDGFLSRLESEIGKTIQYTLMDTDEFKYRLGMYDRFLRDILEYPHQKLINKIGV